MKDVPETFSEVYTLARDGSDDELIRRLVEWDVKFAQERPDEWDRRHAGGFWHDILRRELMRRMALRLELPEGDSRRTELKAIVEREVANVVLLLPDVLEYLRAAQQFIQALEKPTLLDLDRPIKERYAELDQMNLWNGKLLKTINGLEEAQHVLRKIDLPEERKRDNHPDGLE